jgi:putative transposase
MPSPTPAFTWKAKFGGMEVSEAKRLKTLEDENTRLKRLLADAMLDNAALKNLVGKKGDARGQAKSYRPSARRIRDGRTAGV